MTVAKKAAAKKTAARKQTTKPAEVPTTVVTADVPPAPGGPLITSVDALRDQAHDQQKPAKKRN